MSKWAIFTKKFHPAAAVPFIPPFVDKIGIVFALYTSNYIYMNKFADTHAR